MWAHGQNEKEQSENWNAAYLVACKINGKGANKQKQ